MPCIELKKSFCCSTVNTISISDIQVLSHYWQSIHQYAWNRKNVFLHNETFWSKRGKKCSQSSNSVQLVMSKTFFMLMVVISVYVTQIDRYLALVSSINFVDRFWDFFDPLPSSPSKYTDLLRLDSWEALHN